MQQLQPNTTLQGGKYIIERVLGKGNFGITYLAKQTPSREYVAIKEFFLSVSGINDRIGNSVSVPNSVNMSTFEQQKNKFNKEARRLMNLHDEHIVQVFDMFEENGTSYYVMEYVNGESLSDRMARLGRPFTDSEVDSIFPQILDALTEIHSKDILHLDIKPANIMIDDSNNIKLIDFGASKQLTSEGTALTGFAFTPGYAPPELSGMIFNHFGPWTDLYSLGATLYNLLTMKGPSTFDVESCYNGSSQPTNRYELLILTIDWMMSADRRSRPQSAEEIRTRYTIEFVKIDVLDFLKEIFGKEIVISEAGNEDVVEDLHATPSQCKKIVEEIKNIYNINIEGVPLTYKNIVYAVLLVYGIQLDLDDDEESDNEKTLMADSANQEVAPVIISGHQAVDLGLSVLWATMDIGATSEEGYGDCYLWGDPDGSLTRKVQSSFIARWFKGGPRLNVISGHPQYDTASNLWGRRWRIPTIKEFKELATECQWELIDNNHVRLYGPNGNSIVLDGRMHWTGESPFGKIQMFSWSINGDSLSFSLPTMVDLNKDYTDLFFPIRPVTDK